MACFPKLSESLRFSEPLQPQVAKCQVETGQEDQPGLARAQISVFRAEASTRQPTGQIPSASVNKALLK